MLVTLHQIFFMINGVGFFQRHAFFIWLLIFLCCCNM
jgi:hypothetical protein